MFPTGFSIGPAKLAIAVEERGLDTHAGRTAPADDVLRRLDRLAEFLNAVR